SANSIAVSATSGASTITVISPFDTYVTSYGLNPSGNGAAGADPDSDHIPNLVEFALGGNPTVADTSILPAFTSSTVNGKPVAVYQFNRNKTAAASVTVAVEYSTDLSTWTTAIDGQNGVTITTTPVNASTDHVTVTFSNATHIFARLRVTP